MGRPESSKSQWYILPQVARRDNLDAEARTDISEVCRYLLYQTSCYSLGYKNDYKEKNLKDFQENNILSLLSSEMAMIIW